MTKLRYLDFNRAPGNQPYRPKYYQYPQGFKEGRVPQGKAKGGCVHSWRTPNTSTAITASKNGVFHCWFSYGPRIELMWEERINAVL